ncbi:hypothetical protein LIER_13177 [Lithospermum erythrorhizon]|uniref:RNase H type-1 domain-containing protein n=1 Tax=Lithospermum erythrorhizon TaxID=34254 RepID=A0AAV3PXS8_LITER
MTALRMSREKGARHISSMLVHHLICPATLVERASICHCKATITSMGASGLQHLVLRCHGGCAVLPPAHFFPVPGKYGSRSPPEWMIHARHSLPLAGGAACRGPFIRCPVSDPSPKGPITLDQPWIISFIYGIISAHGPMEEAPELVNRIEASQEKVWLLYVDGASNLGSLVVGILLWSPEDSKIECAPGFPFKEMNNEAEYEALVNGLTIANALGG